MKTIFPLSLLLVLIFSFNSQAQIAQQLLDDFKPVSGTIIMPVKNQYLVDLDQTQHLQVGDILSVVDPGEKIIHPITKEVLGQLDSVRGYLVVTQVKSGYSYTEPLSQNLSVNTGDKVIRFEQVPAAVQVDTALESSSADEIKTQLPHLNWVDPLTDDPYLIFQLQQNNLSVKNNQDQVLYTYPIVNGQLSAPAQAKAQQDIFRTKQFHKKKTSFINQSLNSVFGTVGIGGKDKRLENPAIIRKMQQDSGTYISPIMEGTPIGIAIADFNDDGKTEVAAGFEDNVVFASIDGNDFEQEQVVNFPTGIKAIAYDTFDLDDNGLQELYVTAIKDKTISSFVIEHSASGYKTVTQSIPWLIRSVQMPNGQHHLLGQRIGDEEDPFKKHPFILARNSNSITRLNEYPLPQNTSLYSYAPVDDQGVTVASLTRNDYLTVSTNTGLNLWESSTYYGGSEILFYKRDYIDDDVVQPINIPTRLIVNNGNEILTIQNDGQRLFKRFKLFTDSRVIALKWNGVALQETWRTTDQNGYTADFSLADIDNDGDQELALLVRFKKKTPLQAARSSIVIYELK